MLELQPTFVSLVEQSGDQPADIPLVSPEANADRRRAPRLPVNEESSVRLLLPWYGGRRREEMCALVDASPGGIGIRMEERLALGTPVTIDAETTLGSARFRITGQSEVVNTEPADRNGYRVGLRFVDVRWERLGGDSAQADDSSAEPRETPS